MSKFTGIMERSFMPIAGKLSNQRHLKAIRDGMVANMPLLIVGSIFLIVAFPPGLEAAMERFVPFLGWGWHGTFGIMALVAAFSIAFNLARSYNLDGLSAGVLSLCAFITVTPRTAEGDFPTGLMGSSGLFVAIIIALVSTEIYRYILKRNLVIRMPEGVPESVSKAFVALVPAFCIVMVVWLGRLLLELIFSLSIHQVVGTLLQAPLQVLGGSFLGGLVAMIIIQILWSMGIHGFDVVASVMLPVWYALSDQNAAAKAAGEAIPNILGYQMMAIWVAVGGAGAVLALAILLVWRARSRHLKSLGKMTIWSCFFNISEPLVFGMPVVMNPIMLVPFILAPIVMYLTTYASMAIGLVGKPFAMVPWTTPVVASGILSTGDWKGGLLMIINLIIAMAIYYPFFKVLDNQLVKEEGISGGIELSDGGGKPVTKDF